MADVATRTELQAADVVIKWMSRVTDLDLQDDGRQGSPTSSCAGQRWGSSPPSGARPASRGSPCCTCGKVARVIAGRIVGRQRQAPAVVPESEGQSEDQLPDQERGARTHRTRRHERPSGRVLAQTGRDVPDLRGLPFLDRSCDPARHLRSVVDGAERVMDADLHFYFDPVCPFAWMTSKWVRMVAAQRDYQVDWRFISLRILNAHIDYAPTSRPSTKPDTRRGCGCCGSRRRCAPQHGRDAVGPLYEAIGTRIFDTSRDVDPLSASDQGARHCWNHCWSRLACPQRWPTRSTTRRSTTSSAPRPRRRSR